MPALAIFQNIRPLVRRIKLWGAQSYTFLDQHVKAALILIVLITCSCNLIDWSSVRIVFAIREFLLLFCSGKKCCELQESSGIPKIQEKFIVIQTFLFF